MPESKTERTWIRNADVCEAVRDLRDKGNSWKAVRQRIKAQFNLPGKVCDATLREAYHNGPIKFFQKTLIHS